MNVTKHDELWGTVKGQEESRENKVDCEWWSLRMEQPWRENSGERTRDGKLHIPTRVSAEGGRDDGGGAREAGAGQISTGPPTLISFFDSWAF